VDLYALAGAGGTAGPGGSGGIGVSTSLTKYNNGDTGPAGNSGAAGSGLLVFTGNAITVGTSIPGDANHATLNELDLTLDASVRVGTTATPVSLDGGAGGNLVFSGNHLVGTGASTLDLQLAGSGSATIDTVADTLGIDGSPGNSMTGFDSFTLDNNDTFYAGVGNYVVQYASDPDTLVYSQTSGNVTLEGVTSANMLLDFEGFGSSLTAQTLAGDITTSGGGTFIDVTGHSSIELLGYTGAIPGGDVAFTPACFLAGTRVATARGPVAVEDLAVGDRVALARRGGRSRPVVWLGHRRIDCRRHPRPMDVWPIRVAGGAFGAGRPRRDLLLSPDHAVFWRGVLIPVRHLVNGASIVQEQLDEVTYWHVELDRHDVILAEGLPCESYLDTGNRDAFENGGTVVRMHPDFARHMWDAESCAPLVVAGPDLDRVRARLHERGDRGIVNPRDGDLGARGAFVPDRERTAGKIRRA
jgi:hypothetical protein